MYILYEVSGAVNQVEVRVSHTLVSYMYINYNNSPINMNYLRSYFSQIASSGVLAPFVSIGLMRQ